MFDAENEDEFCFNYKDLNTENSTKEVTMKLAPRLKLKKKSSMNLIKDEAQEQFISNLLSDVHIGDDTE